MNNHKVQAATAQTKLQPRTQPHQVIAPYRVNPLGAHVDHQGGNVLAKTIDQSTVLSFWPDSASTAGKSAPQIKLVTENQQWEPNQVQFTLGDTGHEATWVRFAQAAAAALQAAYPLSRGFTGYVSGAQIGAGLSSSASVVLAYLSALASCNNIELDQTELVELSRQVENDFLGLNNGIQDQMSIAFGKPEALSLLDVNNVRVKHIPDPNNADEVAWVLCYSGFSRVLIESGFNNRVDECKQAAQLLDESAHRLGDVAPDLTTEEHINQLPGIHARRARHFYSEVQRVNSGCQYWAAGDWQAFGKLMNASCQSSITQYESGSQPMIDLHDIARNTDGIYGSRFCGGGYGGCVLMLCEHSSTETLMQTVLDRYLETYPAKKGVARIFQTQPQAGVVLHKTTTPGA